MPDFYQRYRMSDPSPSFPFNDTQPDAVVVYLGTNDYSQGASPQLDAAFADTFVGFMENVTQRWYGSPSAPATGITFFAVLGPMSPTLPTNATLSAIARGTQAGFNIHLLNVTTACHDDLSTCTDGCASHPGVSEGEGEARGCLCVVWAHIFDSAGRISPQHGAPRCPWDRRGPGLALAGRPLMCFPPRVPSGARADHSSPSFARDIR
jgi:hypothetical protein